jgi:oligoendopeptidase F
LDGKGREFHEAREKGYGLSYRKRNEQWMNLKQKEYEMDIESIGV